MSRVTREINKVTGTVIALAGRLILYALLVMLLLECVGRGYRFGHEVFCSVPAEEAPGRDISVTVAESETADEVIGRLKSEGLLRDSLIARIELSFYDYKIYPGTYTLNTSMTPKEILQALNVKPEEAESAVQQAVETAAPARTEATEAEITVSEQTEAETAASVQAETAAPEGGETDGAGEESPVVRLEEELPQPEIRINSRYPYGGGGVPS